VIFHGWRGIFLKRQSDAQQGDASRIIHHVQVVVFLYIPASKSAVVFEG
jgi:hypothetical protein